MEPASRGMWVPYRPGMARSRVVATGYSIHITEVSSQYRGREDGRQGVEPCFGIVPGTEQYLAARFCYKLDVYGSVHRDTNFLFSTGATAC
jgi:hypothetical protein